MKNLEKNKIWRFQYRNQVMLTLFPITVFSKKKYKTDETVYKHKTRFVVRDYAQKNDIDYKEKFSVVKYDSQIGIFDRYYNGSEIDTFQYEDCISDLKLKFFPI